MVLHSFCLLLYPVVYCLSAPPDLAGRGTNSESSVCLTTQHRFDTCVYINFRCTYQGLGNHDREKWFHPQSSSGPRGEIRKRHYQQWDEIRPLSQLHPPKPPGTTALWVPRIYQVFARISTLDSFILSSSLSLTLPLFLFFFL